MPSNKNATLRYKTIDSLLCSEEWHTIEQITKACEEALFNSSGLETKVSRVTIYKDLRFLEGLDGVKLESQPGRPVKYRYARDSRTFNGTMVPSSSYADLAYTLEYLESISGLVSIDGTIKKIRRQLEGAGEGMQKYISFQSAPDLKNSDMLWTLYRHIREGNPLRMKYSASYSRTQEIEFQPWYLKQFNSRWFLMGWAYRIVDDRDRTDVGLRCLAIDRIDPSPEGKPRIDVSRKRTRNVKLNTPGCDWYIDFDTFFSDMIGVTKKDGEDPVEILLRADLETGGYDWNRMVTKPIHHSQETWTDGRYGFVRFTVRPNNELFSALLTYTGLELVSPEPVRREFERRIRSLLSHYAQD